MTLDEAIEHAKEVARTCDDSGCAADHIQLAEWLRQARGAGKAARWYTSRIQELEAENAKLRELVRDLYLCSDETCTDCKYHDYSGEGFWCKRGVGWKRARMRDLGIEVGM